MEKDWSEPLRGPEWSDGIEEHFLSLLHFLEPKDMRDALMSFQGKDKFRRCCPDPILQGRNGGQAPEGVIDFDAVQALRVMEEKILGR